MESLHVEEGPIVLEKYSHIAAHCLILPNVVIEAMSMVNKTTKPWGVYFGVPAKRIKERERGLLKYIE